MKSYLITFRIIGEQSVIVHANNATDAKRAALGYKVQDTTTDEVDFIVLRSLDSTVKIEKILEAQ